MSLLVDIADAVVERLQAGVDAEAFAETFAPVRKNCAEVVKEDLENLQCHVVGISLDSSSWARDITRYDVRVDIAFAKQVDPTDDEEIESLIGIVEDVASWMLAEELDDDHPAIELSDADASPAYDHARLKNDGLFVGIVQLTYVAEKSRPSLPVDYLDLGNGDRLNLGNGDLLALSG